MTTPTAAKPVSAHLENSPDQANGHLGAEATIANQRRFGGFVVDQVLDQALESREPEPDQVLDDIGQIIFSDDNQAVLVALAGVAELSPTIDIWLARHPDVSVRRALIESRSDFADQIQMIFARDPNIGIRLCFLDVCRNPIEAALNLIGKDAEEVRIVLAGRAYLFGEAIQTSLAQDSSLSVRRSFVCGPTAPAPVLRARATDPDDFIRIGFVNNICDEIDLEVQAALSQDESDAVRSGFAYNCSNLTDQSQLILAKDEVFDVRLALAGSGQPLFQGAQKILCRDHTDVKRLLIERCPNKSLDTLRILALDPDSSIRVQLAHHYPSLAKTIQAILNRDDNPRVVEAIQAAVSRSQAAV